jgi:RNA polymerase sigma factor (TIGR02999 family)
MADSKTPGEVTGWLERWAGGEPAALDHLAPLVYDQLRQIAEGLLHNERADHTLQATALVHETFKQLLGVRKITLNDRAHFYTFAAKLMRRLLIDHARRWRAAKRGIDFTRVPLNPELAWVNPATEEVLDLSAALEELESLDAQRVRAVELHYFLGCTITETAALLNTSPSTIDRALRFSLAWLRARLHPPA